MVEGAGTADGAGIAADQAGVRRVIRQDALDVADRAPPGGGQVLNG